VPRPPHSTKTTSRFLSLVLRHQPEELGIELDDAGWVDVDVLLTALAAHGRKTSRQELERIVATNNKQRFAFSDDGARIRASQGHSVDVELGYVASQPPAILYHGTVARFLESIRHQGLDKRSRHHVHLSATIETAINVGGRRGPPVILEVAAARMAIAGHAFFVSENGVWLTESVPPEFLRELANPE
jgi:putative RNA 2'-phosphotransferase